MFHNFYHFRPFSIVLLFIAAVNVWPSNRYRDIVFFSAGFNSYIHNEHAIVEFPTIEIIFLGN